MADHTVAAFGTNGFGTDELMSAFWAGARNIKDMIVIHSKLPPDVCKVLGDPMQSVQKAKGDSKRRMSHSALRSR